MSAIDLKGVTYPQLWALTRDQAIRAREEYLAGALMVDLQRKYKVGYGTMQSVIAGRHPALGRKWPSIARGRGGAR
jgi:hypothetical protein